MANKPYCRKCIRYKGEVVENESVMNADACSTFQIDYSLSKSQQEASERIKTSIEKGRSVLIYAVCGAGKTELTYQTIQFFLSIGSKVGIAIPRRDVVIELHLRIAKAFNNNRVVAVYGGNNEIINGDIVICTTHQLYRYSNFFDLLIIDEVDAFPFNGDEVLEMFAKRSGKQFIYLSATPPPKLLDRVNRKEIDLVEISRRYHNFSLPVPQLIMVPQPISIIYSIIITKKYLEKNKPVFIYAPTIKSAEFYFKIFNRFIQDIELVHSKKENRQVLIEKFRRKEVKCLITTTILERGITMENLQVLVLNANHQLFTSQVLIQIAGRVGRKISSPTGDVLFLGLPSKNIKDAINEIKKSNKTLSNML